MTIELSEDQKGAVSGLIVARLPQQAQAAKTAWLEGKTYEMPDHPSIKDLLKNRIRRANKDARKNRGAT
jgi:hypothetical protein